MDVVDLAMAFQIPHQQGVVPLDPSQIYFYDIQRVIPEDPPVVNTLMSGRITVLHDVTRRNG